LFIVIRSLFPALARVTGAKLYRATVPGFFLWEPFYGPIHSGGKGVQADSVRWARTAVDDGVLSGYPDGMLKPNARIWVARLWRKTGSWWWKLVVLERFKLKNSRTVGAGVMPAPKNLLEG
jgi:hypothetical protein